KPSLIALYIASKLISNFFANTTASDSAEMFILTIIWFANFTTLPAPTSPTLITDCATGSNIFVMTSKSTSLQPTMTDSSPVIANGSPPLTGASTYFTFFSSNTLLISNDSLGVNELVSITCFTAISSYFNTAFSPLYNTALTIAPFGNDVIKQSTCCAISLVVAITAPYCCIS